MQLGFSSATTGVYARLAAFFSRFQGPMLGLIATLVATSPAWLPWLDPRLNLWEVDDAKNHLLRLYELDWMLARGVWFPRWFPDLFVGFGYPVLNYYAPASYYLSLGLKAFLGLDYWDAFRAGGVVAAVAGAAGTYALAWTLWRRALPALLAAVALLYGPYAFQVNLFKRGDTPEALGLALIPWLLLSIWQLWFASGVRERLVWSLAVLVSSALAVLAHNISALIAAALASAWVVFLLIVYPRWRSLLHVSAAALVAASLTAFFWLPALGETSLVQLEWATSGNVDFWQWLVDPTGATEKHKHVENRQTRTGYIDLNLHYPHQLIAPPKVSLAQVGLALAGVVFTGVVVLRAVRHVALPRRGRAFRTTEGHASIDLPAERAAPWAVPTFLLIAGACWYLTLAPSATLWERLPGLHLLQFPWRLLGPLALCLALAGAGALASLQSWLEGRWDRRGWMSGAVIVATAMSGVLFNSLGDLHYEVVDPPDRVIDGHALVEDERKDPFGAGTTSGKEFLPRHVSIPDRFYGERRTVRTINTLYPSGEWIGGTFRPLEGPLRLLNWRGGPLWLSARFANDGQRTEPLGLHQLLFAGWEVRLDGTLISPETAPHIDVQDASVGFMVVPIPPGEHTVTLEFGLTRIRALATTITLIGALGVAGALGWWLARRRPRAGALLYPASGAALCGLIIAGLAVRGLLPLVRNVPEVAPARSEHGVWPASGFSGAYDGLLVNVAEAVRIGEAQLSSPTGSALGLNTFLDVRYLRVTDAEGDRRSRGAAATMARQWLYMHPTSTVVVDVALPKNRPVALQSVLALDPNAWEQPVGDGVRFQASVAPLGPAGTVGESVMVLDREVNPRANSGERRWVPVEADLSRWSGSTVRLTLRTLPRDEISYDWAGWGDPVVIARDSSRARTG